MSVKHVSVEKCCCYADRVCCYKGKINVPSDPKLLVWCEGTHAGLSEDKTRHDLWMAMVGSRFM